MGVTGKGDVHRLLGLYDEHREVDEEIAVPLVREKTLELSELLVPGDVLDLQAAVAAIAVVRAQRNAPLGAFEHHQCIGTGLDGILLEVVPNKGVRVGILLPGLRWHAERDRRHKKKDREHILL